MKHLLYFSLLILFGFNTNAQTVQLMTYNLRYDNPNDGINRWDARKDNVINLIEKYSPDVFGTQEGLNHQLEYLNENLDAYSYLGIGRDDGKKKGEYCAIFYKKDELKVIEQSTFWLSTTPDKISVGWDAILERICTSALFENKKSGDRFWVFNAHFDHVGKEAQYESSQLIVKKIQELNSQNYPAILMGDLNLKPESKAIQYLCSELFDSNLRNKKNPNLGTFNAFKHDKEVTDRIDYLFTDENCKVKRCQIIEDKIDSRYPSDHLPVITTVRWNRK